MCVVASSVEKVCSLHYTSHSIAPFCRTVFHGSFMSDRLTLSPPSRLGPAAASFRLDPFETHSKIARLIASSAGVSRADLARITGLARSTVSQHVQPLLDAGLLK